MLLARAMQQTFSHQIPRHVLCRLETGCPSRACFPARVIYSPAAPITADARREDCILHHDSLQAAHICGCWCFETTLLQTHVQIRNFGVHSGRLGALEAPLCKDYEHCTRFIARRASFACSATAHDHPDNVQVPPRTVVEIVGGWLRYISILTVIALPIWIYQGFLALLGVTIGRKTFFATKDRSAMKFKDPFDLEHGFVEVNGVRIHTVSAGRGKGKPLMLFLHGFPELWFSWRKQMQQFKNDYEVVAVDMRGYGESDKPVGREHYIIPTLASDAAKLVKALGHERCVLVAHDWGGVVAWHTAALYPDVVERLVVMGIPHPTAWNDNMDLNQARRSWYMLFFQAPWLPEFLATAADVAFITGAFRTGAVAPRNKDTVSDDDIERYKQGFTRPGATTASINYYRSFFDSETRSPQPEYRRAHEILRRGLLKMPVLMLFAANDSALGTQLVRRTDKYVPDLELHVLEDCSHWVQQDKPELVEKLMRGFLERTAKGLKLPTAAALAA